MNLKFKALSDGSLQIEGVGIPFGGPVSGKDLHGQYFSTKTDFGWDLIPDGHRPLLYQHGLDDTVSTNVIGRWSVKKIDDKGVWIQAQLNARSEYLEEIKELLDKDSLGLSSATMGHLVKVSGKSGEILRWPVVEMSLTPNPANPAAYVVKTAAAITPARYVAKLLGVKHGDHDQADHGNRDGGSSAGSARMPDPGFDKEDDAYAAAGHLQKQIDDFANPDSMSSVPNLPITATSRSTQESDGKHQAYVYATARAASDVDKIISTLNEYGYHAARDEDSTRGVVIQRAASLDQRRAAGEKSFRVSRKAEEVVASAPSEPVEVIEEAVEPVEYTENTLEGGLRELLSDVIAFYLEAHGAHWNVVGDDFKQFHDLFGDIYEDVQSSIDPLAENIRKLNAVAPFSLKDIAADPALSNASGSVNPEDLCEELYASNSVVLMKILSCFNMATSAGEQGIANFLADRQDMHKKWAWQLSASLDERGESEEPAEPEMELETEQEMEMAAPKSRKHGDHDQSDHGNRDGGGGSSGSGANPHSERLGGLQERIREAAAQQTGGNFRLEHAARLLETARAADPKASTYERVAFRDSINKAIEVLEDENMRDFVSELDDIRVGRDRTADKSFRKSRKHGDHDQADHGNRDGGGSAGERASSSPSTHEDIAAVSRGAMSEIGRIREGASNLSNLDRVRLENVEKIVDRIASRHGERYGSDRIASGVSVRDTHDAIDQAAFLVGRIQDESVQTDMRGVVDDLRSAVEGNSKSLNNATRTGRSAQPVARLAVKVGNAPVRKSIDLNELKMQVRAIARDAALKNLGRK